MIKRKLLLSIVIAVVSTLTCFAIFSSASTTSTSDYDTIAPSDDELDAAASPKYFASSENIYGAISNSYEMDIYHYEAPYEGYYAIYTTGNTDTIGAVYEQENFLWWTTSYEQIAYNDDGINFDTYPNFSTVVHLDSGEDYYICVRAYSNLTGNYNLIIEPNEDKKNSTDGGVWTCEYISNSHASSGVWITKKQYLNQEQALLNYLFLDNVECFDEQTGVTINFDLIKATYNQDIDQAITLSKKILSILTNKAPSSISISASILGTIIDEMYDASTDTIDELKQEFETKCIVTKTLDSINGSSATVIYTIQNGMLKNIYFPAYIKEQYYAYNDTIIKGEKYCYGYWS